MSDDETLVFLLSGGVAFGGWAMFYSQVFRVGRIVRRRHGRGLIVLAPLLCGAVLVVLLKLVAADDVRGDPAYLAMYAVLGLAWLVGVRSALSFLGLSARDDVMERGNGAASLALAGAFLGATCCYAGANAGNGPGWWVVVFSAGLATATFLILWAALARDSALADRITIDRDVAAGLRACGYFIGSGLILGRAAAGDWVSAAATVRDFGVAGWPVAPLAIVAWGLERALRPVTDRDAASVVAFGGIPGLAYVAAGIAVVIWRGPW